MEWGIDEREGDRNGLKEQETARRCVSEMAWVEKIDDQKGHLRI